MARFTTKSENNKSELIIAILVLGPFISFLFFIFYLSWRPFTWTEEVNVLAAEPIIVKRSVSREFSFSRNRLGSIKSHSLTIVLNGKNVVWRTNGEWKINHMPEILAFIDGDPVLIFSVATKDPCSSVGFPKNGLVEFKYHNEVWTRISTGYRLQNLKINLLRNTSDFQHKAWHELGNHFDEKFKMVTLSRKLVLESPFTIPRLGSTIDELSDIYTKYLDSCANLDPNKNTGAPKA